MNKQTRFSDKEIEIIHKCVKQNKDKPSAIDAARIMIFRELNITRSSQSVRDKLYSLYRESKNKTITNKVQTKVIETITNNFNSKLEFVHEITMQLSNEDKLDLIKKLFISI